MSDTSDPFTSCPEGDSCDVRLSLALHRNSSGAPPAQIIVNWTITVRATSFSSAPFPPGTTLDLTVTPPR